MPPSSRQPATLLLRVCVICQCVGNAWWFLGNAWQPAYAGETPLFALLWGTHEFGGFGLSEPPVHSVHGALAGVWLAAAAWLAYRVQWPVTLALALLQVGIAGAAAWTGEGFRVAAPALPTLEPLLAGVFPLFSQSARIAAPLALTLFTLRSADHTQANRLPAWGLECLRWAVIATFAAHGLEALQAYPKFIDMLIGSTRKLFGTPMPQHTAEPLLLAIGVADVAVAAFVAVRRSPLGAGYMAVWGLITAASRVVISGPMLGTWGLLTRMPHALAPAVLFLCWRRAALDREGSDDADEPA
ncbi:MAG: hypothetical protein AAF790_11530 [Planctomycetota bacterium]